MAEEVFGEAAWQRQQRATRVPPHLASRPTLTRGTGTTLDDAKTRRRRGNYYARYTKKFSLGNGPPEWVQEYLITKEGGKMLGTLVALAVARMRSLETFIWDMPTGILRDVWMALSSLDDYDDGQECRLERVWVRWHDNFSLESGNPAAPHHPSDVGVPSALQSLDRVEHPSFSALPPLKSLSVLDIDELQYLDEMSVLIGRSQARLKELRVGVARHAMNRNWVTVWDGDGVQQVDPEYTTAGCLTIGEKRLGGVLGVLTGFVCDMKRRPSPIPAKQPRRRPNIASLQQAQVQQAQQAQSTTLDAVIESQSPPAVDEALIDFATSSGITSLRDVLPAAITSDLAQRWDTDAESPVPEWEPMEPERTSNFAGPSLSLPLRPAAQLEGTAPLDVEQVVQESQVNIPLDSLAEEIHKDASELSEADDVTEPELAGKLRLESLELERVPLSVPVLQEAIDWSKLTSLTLLHCQNQEQLWKTLRRAYSPLPSNARCSSTHNSSGSSMQRSRSASASEPLRYLLNLKKIHTNTVSPSLISFIKETLAPDSLQTVFFQEARAYSSTVAIETVFRGVLRRHRSSLTKVLIDSSERDPGGHPTSNNRWRRWVLNRDILKFITSGKMPMLRELGMALDYRDWVSARNNPTTEQMRLTSIAQHFFLQHLQFIPHLRSLYIPFLANHIHGVNIDPRELALQVVDIVALKPEVELCYMGIATKCFEILENRCDYDGRSENHLPLSSGLEDGGSDEDEDDDEGADDVDDEDEDDDHDHDTESEGSESESPDTDSEDEQSSDRGAVAKLRLREILFYDDKVAIFKARHGRL